MQSEISNINRIGFMGEGINNDKTDRDIFMQINTHPHLDVTPPAKMT
jgi:hypothetical protein